MSASDLPISLIEQFEDALAERRGVTLTAMEVRDVAAALGLDDPHAIDEPVEMRSDDDD